MHQTLRALLSLQEIDKHIFGVERELQRLPAERSRRQEALDKRRERLAELEEQARGLRVRIKEIDDLTHVQRQRVRKIEKEAAAARADMALQVAYQHEIRSLKRDIGGQEEEGLQLVENAESIDASAATLRAEIEEEQRIFEEYASNVQSEIDEATRRLNEMNTDRASRLSEDVAPKSLELYGRLLAARGGEAMAELDGRICQACYMEVPPNLVVRLLRGAELIQCPSCDRILYARV